MSDQHQVQHVDYELRNVYFKIWIFNIIELSDHFDLHACPYTHNRNNHNNN